MTRIAILGSCITRDLWPAGEAAPANLLYVSRTSLASLLAPPVQGFRPADEPPGALRPFQHAAMVADLRKTALARLVAFRPTHLILDFIDERFDLLAAGDAVVTHSYELEESGYLAQNAFRGARPIPRLSRGCERLWLAAAAEFAAVLRATPLREAKLILHSARWAARSRDATGREQPIEGAEVLRGRPADIAAYNQMMERYEAAFAAVAPPLSVVSAPDLWIADAQHRWGLSPFHYVPEYYAAIRWRLARLGLEVTPAPAAPSAPAA